MLLSGRMRRRVRDMNKRGRERNIVNMDRKRRLTEMAETKPTAGAARAFVRKAYECCNVAEYMAKKYDIKGEIGIGEETVRADKELP